jgi:hypothetical protein
MKITDQEKLHQMREMMKKSYDKKFYNEKVKDAYECQVCCKRISSTYRKRHEQTKSHLRYVELSNKLEM